MVTNLPKNIHNSWNIFFFEMVNMWIWYTWTTGWEIHCMQDHHILSNTQLNQLQKAIQLGAGN